MSKADDTPEDCHPSHHPAVVRLFTQRFPGVELRHFHSTHETPYQYTAHLHVIAFEGAIETLLRYGLIEREMIACAPKRVRSITTAEEGPRGYWCTTKRAGGRLEVLRHLRDELDRADPLAAFGPWNWPFTDSAVDRRAHGCSYLRLVVDNTLRP